jgi:ribosome-binding protein aMBF1 (putative translation factor)
MNEWPEWRRRIERAEQIKHELKLREIRENRPLESIIEAPGTVASQIERLRQQCRMTVEELAEALDVVPRSVFRHLSGESIPRNRHLAAYERVFSERLKTKIVILKTSG